jgi:hypothetical protein
MSNVIKELKLQLGDKTISLTLEQARKLKNSLDELFGEKIVREEHYHHHHEYNYPWVWQWQYPQPTYPYYTTLYSGTTGVYVTDGNTAFQNMGSCDPTAVYSSSDSSLTLTI